jgi:hypothetical protein
MPKKVLKLDSQDNVVIALSDLCKGEQTLFDSQTSALESDIAAEHKFAAEDLAPSANGPRRPRLRSESSQRRDSHQSGREGPARFHPLEARPLSNQCALSPEQINLQFFVPVFARPQI